MKIWLASADLKLIEEHFPAGIFSGVITNPKVVAEAGRPPLEFFREVCRIAPAAWYQLRDASAAGMLREAEAFLAIDPEKMRIKVPATRAGFEVIATLSRRDLQVMATIVPTASWLVFALAAGARFVAPYGGMLQKRGLASKLEEVVRMQRIIDAQKSAAELCVGIYDVTEFPVYAAHGVRSCFVWGRDVASFLTQPLVDEAAAGFHGDWNALSVY
ncbi:MAG: transaldolase [Opitutaceae bacterium]|jgi:transaldolase|nr:transaldolase [Opitutaceae bacterium]